MRSVTARPPPPRSHLPTKPFRRHGTTYSTAARWKGPLACTNKFLAEDNNNNSLAKLRPTSTVEHRNAALTDLAMSDREVILAPRALRKRQAADGARCIYVATAFMLRDDGIVAGLPGLGLRLSHRHLVAAQGQRMLPKFTHTDRAGIKHLSEFVPSRIIYSCARLRNH